MSQIFFTGTHNTGKTTLAKAIAEGMKVPLIESNSTRIHQAYGVSPADDIPMALRIRIQQDIVNDWTEQVKATRESGAIFDRCPLDFAAYTIADVQRTALPEHSRLIVEYVNHCIDLSNRLDNLFLVMPHGAQTEQRADKPADLNEAYAAHIHILIVGYLTMHGMDYCALPSAPVDRRMWMVQSYLERKFAEASDSRILPKGQVTQCQGAKFQ